MEIDPNRDEIDLYDELLAFSELPPDQQIIEEQIEFASAPEITEPPEAVETEEVNASSQVKNLTDESSLGSIFEDESFKDILEGISPSKLAERASQPGRLREAAPIEPVEEAPQPNSSAETAPIKPVEEAPPKEAPLSPTVSSSKPTEPESMREAAKEKSAADKQKPGTRITIREDKTDGGITLNAEDLLAEEDELIYTSQKTETPPSAIEVLEKVSGPLKPEVLERISGPLEEPKKVSEALKPEVLEKVSGPIKSVPNFPEPTELPPEMHETKPLEPSAAKPPESKTPVQPTGDLLRASAPLKITGFLNEPPPEPVNTSGLVAICPDCGHQSDRQAIICIECGYLFNEKRAGEDDQKTCQDCGSKARSDEMFCPDCGAILLG
jgi:hypothetical protein